MRGVGPRLGPMITLSALVHLVSIGYLLVAVRPQPRIVYRPSYTVDLVDAPRAGARVAPEPPPPPPPAPAPTPPPPAARATPPPPPPAPQATPPPAPARNEMAELERQKAEAEKLRLAELERQKAAEAEKARQAELERQKAAEAEKARQAELERQKAAEVEKARQAELERQKAAEAEKARQAELERQQVEAERQRQEAERQRLEAERQQRLAKLEEERARIREEAERQRLEAERKARLARVEEERARIREVAARAAAARAAEEALKVKFQAYYDNAHRTISGFWIVPEWVRRRDVEVRVSLTVARDGRILSTTIEKRSGFADLDESVVRAVEKARQAGLPPLPPEYTEDQLEFGLIFNPSTS